MGLSCSDVDTSNLTHYTLLTIFEIIIPLRSGQAVDLSVIVVRYNTKELTVEALRSLKAETQKTSYEVIVVDNNSNDGSVEAITAEFPELKLIASRDNLGFAKANNLAIKESTGEYVLLLNPDTVITDGAVDKLFEFAKQQPADIWGGRALNADLTQNENCAGGIFLPGVCFVMHPVSP